MLLPVVPGDLQGNAQQPVCRMPGTSDKLSERVAVKYKSQISPKATGLDGICEALHCMFRYHHDSASNPGGKLARESKRCLSSWLSHATSQHKSHNVHQMGPKSEFTPTLRVFVSGEHPSLRVVLGAGRRPAGAHSVEPPAGSAADIGNHHYHNLRDDRLPAFFFVFLTVLRGFPKNQALKRNGCF